MVRIFLVLLLLSSLMISACGGMGGTQEKIAVLDWEKAVAEHPLQSKLKQGDAVLKDLLQRRKTQEEMAKAQLASLDKLRGLKKISQQTYLSADFNTRMFSAQQRENVKLQKFYAQADAEGEQLISERRQEIEDTYRLKLFNLRMKLESVKMWPEERQRTEAELTESRRERDDKLTALQVEKEAYLKKKMAPYMQQMRGRMDDEAARLQGEIAEKVKDADDKYADMLEPASPALKNALSIMDREIEKQQTKNDELKKQIDGDIESAVMDLVKQRGYTIVFNKFKANVRADDITDEVIRGLAKKQNK